MTVFAWRIKTTGEIPHVRVTARLFAGTSPDDMRPEILGAVEMSHAEWIEFFRLTMGGLHAHNRDSEMLVLPEAPPPGEDVVF